MHCKMFSMQINFARFRSSHVAVQCLASVNNHRDVCKQVSAIKQDQLNLENNVNNVKGDRQNIFKSSMERHIARLDNVSLLRLGRVRAYSTNSAISADVFGDLGNRKFEKIEMDEDEKAEERFVENESRAPRRLRLTPGGYAKLIKEQIGKKDFMAALQVLDKVKENGDVPTVYMYNLLLRAFANVGDLKMCRSLYAKMKKLQLACNAATYTSLINVCAKYNHSESSLEYLEDLREEFMEKNIVLNQTHYNAMIVAYGRHNKLVEAFKLADEMRDNKLPTDNVTFNSLLVAAISDRDSGLQHALFIWQLMRRHRILPTISTYNLMLRACRECKLGDLTLLQLLEDPNIIGQISMDDTQRSDLLSLPPNLSVFVVKEIEEQLKSVSKDSERKEAQSKMITDNMKKLEAKRLKNNTKDLEKEEPKETEKFVEDAKNEETRESENSPMTADVNSGNISLSPDQKYYLKYPLQKIHKQNKLILFGGLSGILNRMSKDSVEPDQKTITLLIDLIPNSAAAENNLLKLARSKGIPLDVAFYNALMKKRTQRGDFEGAKQVLDDIQRSGLCPDVISWGILAIGCQNSEDARELMDGMALTGHRLNPIIAGTLITVACKKIRFGFIIEIMNLMAKQQVKPDFRLYQTLDAFQKEMEIMIKCGKFTRTVNDPAFKTGYTKFRMRYSSWQEEMGRKHEDGNRKKAQKQ